MGLIQYIVQTPLEQLSIGENIHNQLASKSNSLIETCLKRDNYRCIFCGVTAQDFMEVEHHYHNQQDDMNSMFTLCRICHQLRHVVWASQRRLFRIIWSPTTPQITLNRLAMAAMNLEQKHELNGEGQSHLMGISNCIDRREVVLADILGSSDPLAMIESLLHAKHYICQDQFLKLVTQLDSFIRFWPNNLNNQEIENNQSMLNCG